MSNRILVWIRKDLGLLTALRTLKEISLEISNIITIVIIISFSIRLSFVDAK